MVELLKGRISDTEGLKEVLEIVATFKEVSCAVLEITSAAFCGRMGIAWGRYITGAMIEDSEERGKKALRKMLRLREGKFVFVDNEDEPVAPELRQSLGIDLQRVVMVVPQLDYKEAHFLFEMDESADADGPEYIVQAAPPAPPPATAIVEPQPEPVAAEPVVAADPIAAPEPIAPEPMAPEPKAPFRPEPPPIPEPPPKPLGIIARRKMKLEAEQKPFEDESGFAEPQQLLQPEPTEAATIQPEATEPEPTQPEITEPEPFESQPFAQPPAFLHTPMLDNIQPVSPDFDPIALDPLGLLTEPEPLVAPKTVEPEMALFEPTPFPSNPLQSTAPWPSNPLSAASDWPPQTPALDAVFGEQPEEPLFPREPAFAEDRLPHQEPVFDDQPQFSAAQPEPDISLNRRQIPFLEMAQKAAELEYDQARTIAEPVPAIPAPQRSERPRLQPSSGALLQPGVVAGPQHVPPNVIQTAPRLRPRPAPDSDAVGIAIFCVLFFVVSCAGTVVFGPRAWAVIAGLLHLQH